MEQQVQCVAELDQAVQFGFMPGEYCSECLSRETRILCGAKGREPSLKLRQADRFHAFRQILVAHGSVKDVATRTEVL